MNTPPKYPRTKHWPDSETIHSDDTTHDDPEFFLGQQVVVTEKLDGGNTCLYNGKAFARSTGQESTAGWFAMVKKHHSWKTIGFRNDACFYGEDLYGVHSIKYDPLKEDETFRLFALRYFKPGINDVDIGWFADWELLEKTAMEIGWKTVPVIFKGRFESIKEITEFFKDEIRTPSALGPDREGFVMRLENSFDARDFSKYVTKYVRANHVQTDQHWTRNWKSCELK